MNSLMDEIFLSWVAYSRCLVWVKGVVIAAKAIARVRPMPRVGYRARKIATRGRARAGQ